MQDVFQAVQASTLIAIIVASLVLIGAAILIIGFIQGREISIWPPRVGPLQSKPSAELAVKDEVKKPSGRSYDLFVSAPMAAFDAEEEYQTSRAAVTDTVLGIKKNCGFQDVFYAGAEITGFGDFQSDDVSVSEDYDACYRSKYFMLIYPEKIVTSALLELGWAMALQKPSVIFVKDRDDLPFLAKSADSVFRNIRIYEYRTSVDIINRFDPDGCKIFKQLEENGGSRRRR